MAVDPERLQKLKAALPREDLSRIKEIIDMWGPINEATLGSGLIPRFQEIFQATPPVFIVHDVAVVAGMPITQLQRNIYVFFADGLPVPGFRFEYSAIDDGHPVYLTLALDIRPQVGQETQDPNPQDFRSFFDRPAPYWWPVNYPKRVVDMSDYTDWSDWDKLERRIEVPDPFEDVEVYRDETLSSLEDWQNPRILGLLSDYFRDCQVQMSH